MIAAHSGMTARDRKPSQDRYSMLKILAFALALLAAPANAQDAALASFFKDKTVTIGVGSSTGGGLDTFGRLVSRHMGKHIPGNPTVVVSNMPGAGGNVLANHLDRIAPKDGTFMGITFPSIIIDPLLAENHRGYDPTKFNYLGNANPEVLVCLVRQDAPAKSLADILDKEMIIGATAPGSTTADFPMITKGLLGAKFRLVTGYQGSREVTLAMEKNEVQGICGLGWSTVRVQYPDVLAGKSFARVFSQEDIKGHAQLNAANVPMMMSLAKTDADRQALSMFYAQNAFSRPFILPPGVPAERVAAMRAIFLKTINDPELQAEAAKMKIDAEPTSGEELQKIIERMYATPKDVVERVRKAMGR
jgi:tripartite-type tricarboxylate transporter receptor subunit TctC